MRRIAIACTAILVLAASSPAEDDHGHEAHRTPPGQARTAAGGHDDAHEDCHGDSHDEHGHGDGDSHAAKPEHAQGGAKDEHGHADEHDEHGHGDEHGHADDHDGEKGPRGGRLLRSGDFAVEVTIFEAGVAPQLRLYLYDDGDLLAPQQATASVTLRRLGGAEERFSFEPRGDFLLGDKVVAEPHSFRVAVQASHGSHRLDASYETVEARVTLEPEVAAASGIVNVPAASRSLGRTRRLNGRLGIASDRLASLRPRFAGTVREATGRVGDRVAAGMRLATIENSQTLATFALAAPFDGTLLERHAVAGAIVSADDVLFVVADLRELWADFDVYGSDAPLLRVGESIRIEDDRAQPVEAKLSYISPLRDVHTQTLLARAVLPNPDGQWASGSFVTGTVAIEEEPAAVAVPPSALQTWRGQDAVFRFAEGAWEARPVVVGRSGDEWVEIVEGLAAGDVVATGNTFVLRAEIEKAGAAHVH